MHRVAVVAADGVIPFDLVTPAAVFSCARLPDGRPAYDVRVCGTAREVDAGAFSIRVRAGLGELARADTIILPGLSAGTPIPRRLVGAIRKAADGGTRIASVCGGAFILAETGLLDGRRATTHWVATQELARRHPRVRVDPNVLYVDEGQFLTSAGAAAAFDLCLYMIRLDHGSAVALEAARASVVPLEREGGQSQFIVHQPPNPDGSSLAPLLEWLEGHLERDLALEEIAKRAGMSIRTLNRRFREQTGTTPLQWLIKARLRRAQVLLETTSQSVERIAAHVGFRSPAALREHFRRAVSTSPVAYRRSFRGRRAPRARGIGRRGPRA